jgi:hypothetical protein
LEERIIDAAGRMAAAQCRWLLDLADLDTRGGGDSVEYASTAAWLGWRCGVQSHLAKEYVAVGCALKALPLITEEFSRGRLSWSQVRMLARVATGQTEQTLIHIARNSPSGSLLVVGRYRSLLEAESAARVRHRGRYLSTWFDPDGFFVLRGRLSPEDGAVVEAALQRAMSSMETSSPLEAAVEKAPGHVYNHHGAIQADALVEVARQSLSPGTEGRAMPEMIVHIELDPAAGGLGEDCRLECGVPLAPETALRLSCDAAVVPLIEDPDGNPLSVGRRTRSIPPPLRRALSARDGGCCFPGCTNKRFLHGHHIKHWARGGHTCLDNLTELCRYHHVRHEALIDRVGCKSPPVGCRSSPLKLKAA